VLAVEVLADLDVGLPCLIDTGALRTRLPGWVAEELRIDIDAIPGERIGLAGGQTTAHPADVVLSTAAGACPTTVWFCRGWHSPFGLLGQEGFLDRYRLTLDVAEGWFALQAH
jgi:hypothetical protein